MAEKQPQESPYMSVHEQRAAQPSAGKQEENFTRGNSAATGIEDPRAWREKQNEEKIDEENSVTFYSSGQNEEHSKAFIESLGSWINDLFNVPGKNPRQAQAPVKEDPEKDLVLEEDPEYLKSISAIKEQFRKKLKSETSIQVSTPEKPFLLNFDRVLDKGKNGRRNKSLPPTPTSPDWLDECTETEEQVTEPSDNSIRRYNPNLTMSGLIIRTNDDDECAKPAQAPVKELNNSILMKGKKKGKGKNRHDISDLEEYIFPTPSELSKRILLNVNDNEKCNKIYKNTNLGVQESQHYGQRKSKSHQTNARCYTTTANVSPRKPKGTRFSPYCTSAATAMKGTDDILRRNSPDLRRNQLRKPTKREISEITRDSMTFLKVKNPKPVRSVPVESGRIEVKTNSDELVKYLMKKIKTTRPSNPKNRTNLSVTQLLSNPRNRFMQSATNTLVSVMAKNEAQTQAKSQKFTDPRPFPGKELILKNDVRVDVSRAIATNKYSRLSYLLEDNRMEDDSYLLERSSFRNTRRLQDELQKRDVRKVGNKFNRREEVKNMLSKIDNKYSVFPGGKKPKGIKKKPEEELITLEVPEEPNARFQKQHELFRTNLKPSNGDQEQETETKAEVQANAPETPASLSTELAVIDANLDTDGKSQEVAEGAERSVFEECTVNPSEFEYKMDEFLDMVEKPASEKQEKPEVFRANSLEFLKDDSKMMLSPLEKLCIPEREPQREPAKTHETPLCPAELGQVKPAETLLLNRKYSTVNTMNEGRPKFKTAAWSGAAAKTAVYLSDPERDMSDKKDAKEKKKVKPPKSPKDNSEFCGFEKTKKKPGPNCEKEH